MKGQARSAPGKPAFRRLRLETLKFLVQHVFPSFLPSFAQEQMLYYLFDAINLP
jgi:hypothetical protein